MKGISESRCRDLWIFAELDYNNGAQNQSDPRADIPQVIINKIILDTRRGYLLDVVIKKSSID